MEIELGRQRQQIVQDRAQTELAIERERSERKRVNKHLIKCVECVLDYQQRI